MDDLKRGTVWVDGVLAGELLDLDADWKLTVEPVLAVRRRRWWKRLLRRQRSAWRQQTKPRTGTLRMAYMDYRWEREVLRFMGLDPGPVGTWWQRTVGWLLTVRVLWRVVRDA